MNHFTQLSDEIIMKDLGGQEYIVVRMHCNITNNKGYGLTIDIIDQALYNTHFEECKLRIQQFKAAAEEKANENGLVVF
jgi:hypothetical protein